MSPAWRFVLYCGGYVLLLPVTLFGLAVALTVYGAHSFRFHEGALFCVAEMKADGRTSKIWGNPGAQTFGWLVIGASEEELARTDLRVHELVHVAQALACALLGAVACGILWPILELHVALAAPLTAFSGGLGFAVLYGVCFLVPWVADGFGHWHDAYRKNPFEGHAYDVGDRARGWGAKPFSRPHVPLV